METLLGTEALQVLRNIMSNRNPVSLRIPGTDYTRLTILFGLAKIGDETYIKMDGIEGLEAFAAHDPKLIFEFLDDKRIPYRFQSRLYKVGAKEFWAYLPRDIIRLQRRQSFRVELPSGCKMQASFRGETYTFTVRDISLGGASITLPKRSFLGQNQEVSDIRLSLLLENETTDICIKSAITRTITEDRYTGIIACGLKFEDVDIKTRNILQDYLRRIERHLIRKLRG